MRPAVLPYLLVLAIVLSGVQSRAQAISIGPFSSITGHGLSFSIDHELRGEMDIISISTDTYGLLSARSEDLGFRINYSHQFVYSLIEGEDFVLRLHSGVGFTTGYVHDYENGAFLADKPALRKEMGVIAGLNCHTGVRFDFMRPFAIEITLSLIPGIHIRRDSESGIVNLALYQRGIYHCLLPQISLYYLL